ncbi:MAG: cyclic nucleotide-binding domain-containing protein [Pseudomonadota bacterium]|nr:cyclic nucleotide-binding domain-containing protein [Pseudomonadota bacterium]
MRAIFSHCKHLPEQTFAPGDFLISEGGSGEKMYVLIEGDVEVLRGKVRVAAIDEPGAIFGEMSALLEMPYSASVRARSPVRAHVIDDAVSFLRSQPEITFHAAQLLARRLRDATTYLADLKQQFHDQSGHLGMVDEILDALTNEQKENISPKNVTPAGGAGDDPRL